MMQLMEKFMFKKAYITSFLIVIGLFLAICVKVFHVDESDIKAYLALEKVASKKKDGPNLTNYTQHIRDGVVKELWVNQKEPKAFRITSKESELFFFHDEKALEVIEQLKTVTCMMQDDLFYLLPDGQEVIFRGDKLCLKSNPKTVIDPQRKDLVAMQNIRFMKATNACYNYMTQLFVAENVSIWKYQIKGHTLPKSQPDIKPLMTGKAESIELLLDEDNIDFRANRLKATFDTGKV